jgi:hypothetical protein
MAIVSLQNSRIYLMKTIVGLGFIAAGVFLLWYGIKQIWLFVTCPAKKINQIAIGQKAYLKGIAAGDPELQSPFTQTPCLFWFGQVVEIASRQDIFILYEEYSKEPFLLADRTGQVDILPEQANFNFQDSPYFEDVRSGNSEFQDPRSAQVVASLGIVRKEGSANNLPGRGGTLHIEENLIQPKQQLFVWGKVMQSNDPTKLAIESFLIADRPRKFFFIDIARVFVGSLVCLAIGMISLFLAG